MLIRLMWDWRVSFLLIFFICYCYSMDLSGKIIAVYGLGVSGLGALTFLKDQPLKSLVIVNQGEPQEWQNQIPKTSFPVSLFNQDQDSAAKALSTSDLILMAPGIPRTATVLNEAHEAGVPIWNELELASRYFLSPILALTGTNGKTTSVSFMADVLRNLGLNSFVGGNIGRSFLEGIQTKERFDVALLEVSSFQCESFETLRPEVAGILNLFPNHGERYESVDDYRKSKWYLAQAQEEKDLFIVGPGCGDAPFDLKSTLVRVEEGEAEKLSQEFDLSHMKIVGAHNRYNLWFSYLLLKEYCDRNKIDGLKEAFQKAINEFPGVAHRIEYVGEDRNLVFYNDAKSTNWDATLTALKAVGELNLPITLLLGGKLRGHNDHAPKEFCDVVKNNKIDVILFGESGELLKDDFKNNRLQTIEEALFYARKSHDKRVILLSPAFPSFDQFKNYVERGEAFKKLLKI